jgi:hypothetical protein
MRHITDFEAVASGIPSKSRVPGRYDKRCRWFEISYFACRSFWFTAIKNTLRRPTQFLFQRM